MQTQRQLVDDHQRKAFRDFVGQEDLVRYLAGLAKAGVIRNMLFTGPAGVGKTTIARAYAQALNCEAPLSGNACLECPACRNPSAYFREVDTPTLNQTEKDFKKTMMYQLRPFAATTKVGVTLFDEAHALMPNSSDMLLNHIVALQQRATDANNQRQAVLFATTDGSKLSSALRSRLMQRSLSNLNHRDLLELAKRVATGAALDCEEGALRCLAGWSNGCARNLVNALDQYARDRK
jgi:DNA polymerase-3 subunit gamma/tau